MDQNNGPRFSHIIVGQTGADDEPAADDEEIITIGVVDVGQVPPQPAQQEASGTDQPLVAKQQIEAPTPADELPTQAAEDSDFGPPMSLVQKLIIVACGIALIIAIVLLVIAFFA
jgi:hypothetical protein